MLKNQRGNTLITVMITSLVVITIGMGVLSASIGGAKRTEVRETEIDITYDGLRLIDEMTSELSTNLSRDYFNIKNLSPLDLSSKLNTYFSTQLNQMDTGDSVSCVNVVDVTANVPKYLISGEENQCLGTNLAGMQTFNIDPALQLTRVLEFVVSVNNPEDVQGKVNRTIRKRIILSPLPGFLKYAAGAGNKVIINGSPNIAGNIFSNELVINKNAQFQLTDGAQKEIETPFSSIFGDIYINSARADYTAVMDYLTPEKFYHNNLPNLKNDSQFISVDFEETFTERVNVIQQEQGFSQVVSLEDLPQTLSASIKDDYTFNLADLPALIQRPLDSVEETLNLENILNLQLWQSDDDSCGGDDDDGDDSCAGGDGLLNKLSYKLIDNSLSSTIQVPGDLVISSVSSTLNFPGKIIADGDVYIIGNKSITLNDIIATGDIHLVNLKDTIKVKGNIISAGDITIQGNEGFLFQKDSSSEEPGYILAGKSLTIQTVDSTSTIVGNLIAGGDLLIQGDSNEESKKENDEIIFDSVVYAGGEAFISNLNISGYDNNTKQLVLLSGDKLTMTRMNEYRNFEKSKEPDNFDGLITDDKIKPLKAFFYTNGSAELYGVGSLFHIDGGVFANDTLVINAIRGEIDEIQKADLYSTKITQDNYLSRFNVNYNRDILLQKIDALPKTEVLSLFSDEVSVQ
ncbi:hypothetical protein V1502_15485 [Bacillus sp. SCS-153A]|uniref:hypothetical protein n=1 Tax=Rossellomorea sedimentorum TaxID=3115294 RepID=UPI0039069413